MARTPKPPSNNLITTTIDGDTRRFNTEWFEGILSDTRAVRTEYNRPSDLPLIRICLQYGPLPSNFTEVAPGVYAVDTPADVYKTVWFVDGGFWVATYRNAQDRLEDMWPTPTR